MKQANKQTSKYILAGTLLALAIPAHAAVLAVGEDTTTLSNWRTAAALETDNQYGTQGYVLYGIDAPDGNWSGNGGYDASSLTTTNVTSDSQISLPSYIGDIALSAGAYGRWSGNGNTSQIQDPGNGNTLTNTPVLAWGTDPYTFTFTRSSSDAFRLTVILNEVDNENYTWDTAVDAGTAGSASITGATVNGIHNATYHVYDIDAGTDNVVLTTDASGNPGRVVGFAFDAAAVPEPSSAALLGLGGLALILRRRK